MKERLTNKDGLIACQSCENCEDNNCAYCAYLAAAITRLMDYESKIENKTFIELLFKAGDKVYQFDNGGKIYESEIKSIYYANNTLIYDCGYCAFDERAIGESIFLSEAEAEKRLEELKGR